MISLFRRTRQDMHAVYDCATGLYPYWYLQRRAAQEIARSRRHERGLICVSLWAATGEDVSSLTTRLRTRLREGDLAASLGGGHVAVLLTEGGIGGARTVLNRLLHGLLGVTGGIACFPADGKTFDELLACAKFRGLDLGFDDAATDAA